MTINRDIMPITSTEYAAPQCREVEFSSAAPLMGSYFIPDIHPTDLDPGIFDE